MTTPETLRRQRSLLLSPALALPLAVLGGLLAVRLAGFIARMVGTTAFGYQFDPTEGILLSEVHLLAYGDNIYSPFTGERFISAPYPPLYYALLAPMIRIVGTSFTWGRIVALVAVLGVAWLLWVAMRPQLGRWLALVPGAIWLASTPLLVWGNRLKPDQLAVALSLAGVVLLMRSERRLAWAAVLFVLAGYAKQSALAGPIAAGLWLALRDWRAAARFSGWMLLFTAVPFALLDLITSHGFYIHMIDFHALPWDGPKWLRLLWEMASYHGVLTLFSIIWIALVLRGGRRDVPLPALYIPLAALGSFSGGTFGGYHNHTLEFLAAICLGAGLLLGVARQRGGWALSAATGLLAVQVALAWITPGWLAWELSNLPSPERQRRMDGLASFVAGQPGPVWSDNVGLIATVGKPIRFNDPLIMAQSAILGWWDERTFVGMIERREFSAILWRDDLDQVGRPNDLSPAMYDAIRQHYVIKYRDAEMVYVPRE